MKDSQSLLLDLILGLESRQVKTENALRHHPPYPHFGDAQQDWADKAKEAHDVIQRGSDGSKT